MKKKPLQDVHLHVNLSMIPGNSYFLAFLSLGILIKRILIKKLSVLEEEVVNILELEQYDV